MERSRGEGAGLLLTPHAENADRLLRYINGENEWLFVRFCTGGNFNRLLCYRCRANFEQISQSRPGSGRGLSHFFRQRSLNPALRGCSFVARMRLQVKMKGVFRDAAGAKGARSSSPQAGNSKRLLCYSAAERKGKKLKQFKHLCLNNGSSQGHNMALTVLFASSFLDSGGRERGVLVFYSRRQLQPPFVLSRCRADMAHTREPRPDFGLGYIYMYIHVCIYIYIRISQVLASGLHRCFGRGWSLKFSLSLSHTREREIEREREKERERKREIERERTKERGRDGLSRDGVTDRPSQAFAEAERPGGWDRRSKSERRMPTCARPSPRSRTPFWSIPPHPE